MLHAFDDLRGYAISAKDGELGSVKDLYFDDSTWAARYLVADTRRWLPGRKVLLAPEAVDQPDAKEEVLRVSLTSEQVRNSPDIAEDAPISAEQETALHDFYQWRPYWVVYPGYAGPIAFPPLDMRGDSEPVIEEDDGPHLRSSTEVEGYDIATRDGNLGHVETFLVDDEDWVIRYLVVDTRNWLPGRKVLVSPDWIDRVSWTDRTVWLDLEREQVKNSPPYDPAEPVTSEYESLLFGHYGRPLYWTVGSAAKPESLIQQG